MAVITVYWLDQITSYDAKKSKNCGEILCVKLVHFAGPAYIILVHSCSNYYIIRFYWYLWHITGPLIIHLYLIHQ